MLRSRGIFKRDSFILFSLFILFFLGGCATAGKTGDDYEKQILRSRISFLENKIADLTNILEKEKEKKQDSQEMLGQQEQRIRQKRVSISPKAGDKAYYSFVIKIQTALRNAGFNPGLIDGKMGARTRVVLKEFQKANSLPASGQVDKQTWTLLRKYL